MADVELTQLPQIVNISAVVRDDFSSLVDFDIDLTGYTVTAFVDYGSSQVAFTVADTNLSTGQVTISLTDTQMTTIGVGNHKWYAQWSVGGLVRTVFAGDFTVTKYGE